MTKIREVLNGKGTVSKRLIDLRTGEVIKEFTDHNLIVKTGRLAIINLIAGKANMSVTKMAIGAGGTADMSSNAFNPIPPVEGDIELVDQKAIISITSRDVESSNTNPKVRFVALFDCKEVNSLVNEVGLFMSDSTTMFARHTFPTVSLLTDTNFALEVTWEVEF